MTAPLKQRIRRRLEHSAAAAHWVATLHSKVLGLLAWRHRLRHLGRCHIALSAKITGWSACEFQRNVVIGARSWINVNHRAGAAPSLVIGENSFIGQDNFITVGRQVRFGPYCLTAAHCAYIGSTHLIDDPMLPYAVSGTTSDADIVIGANCFFGYGASVLGQVRIGHGSIIGAGASVRADIPPFCIAVGNPARVLKHYDFRQHQWRPGERSADAANLVPNEDDYIRELRSKRPFLLQPVSAASAWLGDI